MQRFNKFVAVSIFTIIGLALLLIFSSPVQALMINMSLDDLTQGSDAIVIGTVVEKTSGWNSTHNMICTSVTISVEESLKGNIAAGTKAVITVPGGKVGEVTQRISDMPGFIVGERTLVFLNNLPAEKFNQASASQTEIAANLYQVYGCYQGKFTIDNGMVEGMELDNFKGRISGIMAGTPLQQQPDAVKNISKTSETSGKINTASGVRAAALTTISPSTASAGTDTEVTITGTGFGATQGSSSVQFFYQTPYDGSGDRYIMQDAVHSWSNSQIRCTVPAHYAYSYDASASSGPVYVVIGGTSWSNPLPFTVTFSNGKVKWPGSSPVVTYKVNASTATIAAVNSAATTWNNAGSPFRFSYGGTTSATAMDVDNGINEILWNYNPTAGVLAWASVQDTAGVISECDIEFNLDYTWNTLPTCPGGQYDVEAIALHELGHWLCLNDLYGDKSGYPSDTSKVMFGRTADGTTKRALTAEDIAGIRYIYGTITPPGAPPLSSPGPGANVPGTQVAFYWAAPSGAGIDNYWLRVNTNSSFTGTDIVSAPVGYVGSATISGFSNTGATYYWYVLAHNVGGWGSVSSVRSFINGAAISLPGAPPLSSPGPGANVAGSAVTFSWTAPSGTGIDNYWLRVNTNSSFTGTDIVSAPVGYVGSARISGFSNTGATYYWYVLAHNAAGWGTVSSVRSFINGATISLPGAPPLSSPGPGANVAGSAVTFSWTAPSGTGIDNYWLRVNTNSSFTGTDIVSAPVGYVGSARISGFSNTGATYYWYVLAHNAAGWGSVSSVRSFINGATISLPGAPPLSSPPDGAHVPGTQVTFSWTAPSGVGIDNYYLRVNTNSSFTGTDEYSSTVGYRGSITLTGAPNNSATYYWYVVAHNAAGWGPVSSVRSFINGP